MKYEQAIELANKCEENSIKQNWYALKILSAYYNHDESKATSEAILKVRIRLIEQGKDVDVFIREQIDGWAFAVKCQYIAVCACLGIIFLYQLYRILNG